ncbi:putative NAD dependent epimerase/dehydratase [Hyaloscypha variabilis F]|uniref:Putative NAD dependent epimerase/dehydratase n=1 Tax=Hyaloscypha variabilis (strain UAMH 11265 / GT02V1 / F) TaxID=1149755 RepID=A0A2J6RE50_HYAVF|nr:putative NAD dependent epimerase/dehydratase [Hyaloscypha variabilis F]
MTKLLVVIGITGQQGGSVASLFSQEPGWKVRGITRNPSSPSALAWISKGVEMVQADLNEPSTLLSAFIGATALFVTTNFWAPFYNPRTLSLLKENQTLGEYCSDLEFRAAKNAFDAASQVQALERIVVSSLVDAEKLSGGKYKGVYHWEGKAAALKYLKETYPDLAGKLSVVVMGNYMGNWLEDLKLRKTEAGYRLALVGSGTTPLPHIDAERDTGYIVRALLECSPGKTVLGAGEMISWSDMLKVWCEVNKVEFGGFDPLSVDQFTRFIPVPGLGRELGEMFAFMDEFGYAGGDPDVVRPSELGVPCSVTSWKDWVERKDWSKVLKA